MAEQLKIISLNCRGLRDKNKRKNLFFWLKNNNFHIILLQETFWTEDIKNEVEKDWGGKMVAEAVPTGARGLCFGNKKNVYPCEPPLYHVKVGFRGVYTTRTWFP